MTRGLLRWLARIMIGTLLLSQLAVTAHACSKTLPSAAATGMSAKAEAPMQAAEASSEAQPDLASSDCADMVMPTDAAPSKVCFEHCHYGQQSDHASTITVPVALMTALYAIPSAPEVISPPRTADGTLNALVAASPPHTVLHCVYRI